MRLGRALALHLARRGFDIALHYGSSEEAAGATADEIRALGRACETFRFDFINEPDAGRLLERVTDWRRPDLLINSASVYDQAPILETDRALLERQFAVNLFAPFDLIRAFGTAKNGVAPESPPRQVINILDNNIAFQQFEYAAYLLSKKTLTELTRIAAMELAPGVRVNGIAPGVILPAAVRTEDYLQWRARGIPLQRQGAPDNIGRALDYLLDNDFVTGQILVVDGGESLTNTGRNAAAFQPEDAEKNA